MTISGVNVRADSSTRSTILAPGRTELSGIAGQKDTHEVISWVFCLRLLWRVNCEALRIAAGQNLKRLLKKRGWGRRSFPTEAMAMASPPNWEPEKSPRHNLLKSPSVAVASLVAYGAAKTFFEPQTSWFSLEITIFITFSSSLILSFECSAIIFIARFASLPI